MRRNRLKRDFFERNTHLVAKDLLGKILIRRYKNQILSGRIVEVEAYVGEDDLASHASRGRTPRTDIMFGEAGHAYVYFIYGMYFCLNIVTEANGFPAAILIRALEPTAGMNVMHRYRKTEKLQQLTNGPGKLCQALNITKDLNGVDMTVSNEMFMVDDGFTMPKKMITTSPRIGVDYAGAHAHLPWRYYVRDNAFVSR